MGQSGTITTPDVYSHGIGCEAYVRGYPGGCAQRSREALQRRRVARSVGTADSLWR